MAPQKRQASQREASRMSKRKTKGSYSTNAHTVKERKRREPMDDRSWAKDVFRRRVNTAVSIAKARLRKSVEFAQLSVEEQGRALLREKERVHSKCAVDISAMVSASDNNYDEAPAASTGIQERILGRHSESALSAEAGSGVDETAIRDARGTPIVVEVDDKRQFQANVSMDITIRMQTTPSEISVKITGSSDRNEV